MKRSILALSFAAAMLAPIVALAQTSPDKTVTAPTTTGGTDPSRPQQPVAGDVTSPGNTTPKGQATNGGTSGQANGSSGSTASQTNASGPDTPKTAGAATAGDQPPKGSYAAETGYKDKSGKMIVPPGDLQHPGVDPDAPVPGAKGPRT